MYRWSRGPEVRLLAHEFTRRQDGDDGDGTAWNLVVADTGGQRIATRHLRPRNAAAPDLPAARIRAALCLPGTARRSVVAPLLNGSASLRALGPRPLTRSRDRGGWNSGAR
ncbi:hypothetical protein ABZ153_00185 [Streptomyces sp. NPDC006290]|uniref:hypothetical protein n=1 Tax=Streptomyces sp. NPDC006290 TaxID=3156745 RepID=UPI00339ECE33